MACYDSSECFEECATGYVKVASGLFCWDRCCPLAPPPLPASSAPSAPGPACYEDSGCFTDCAPGFVTVASSACWEFCCVERSQPHTAIPEHRDVVGVVVPAIAFLALAVVCAYVAVRYQERRRALLDELVELPYRNPSSYDDPTSGRLLTPSIARSDECSHSSVSMSPSSTYMSIGDVITPRAEQCGAPEPPPLSPSSSTASPPSSRPPLPPPHPPSPPLPPLPQLCL